MTDAGNLTDLTDDELEHVSGRVNDLLEQSRADYDAAMKKIMSGGVDFNDILAFNQTQAALREQERAASQLRSMKVKRAEQQLYRLFGGGGS